MKPVINDLDKAVRENYIDLLDRNIDISMSGPGLLAVLISTYMSNLRSAGTERCYLLT